MCKDVNEKIKISIICDAKKIKPLGVKTLKRKYNLKGSIIRKILNDAHIYSTRLKKLIGSNKSQKIIEDYKKAGGNLTNITKKYNLKDSEARIILNHFCIKLKTAKQIRDEGTTLGINAGQNHPFYGRQFSVSYNTKFYFYDNVTYEGTWEFKFGLWLKKNNIKFKCHKGIKPFECTVNGKQTTYNPDFYLVDDNKYIEIKGYWRKNARQKFDVVKSLYPDVIFEVYDEQKLEKLGIFDIDKKLNICIDEYEISYKDDKTLTKFIEKNEKSKNNIIKDYLIVRLTFGQLAIKYNTTRRIISRIYDLWIKDYYENIENRRQFSMMYCLDEIFEQYKNNCDLNKLTKKYKIKRSELNKILPQEIKAERIRLQQEKYNQNYNRHVESINGNRFASEISDDIKNNVLNDYKNGLSIKKIRKKYKIKNQIIKEFLISNNIDVRRQTIQLKFVL